MEIVYTENGDLATFDGHKFRKDKDTGYYLNSSMRKRLHRYVWEYYNGTVPEGYHIHHKNGDKSNNALDNLEMLSAHDHETLHGALLTEQQRQWRRENIVANAMPKAKAWHGSEDGLKWHSEHGKDAWAKRSPTTAVCEWCGKPMLTYRPKVARFCSGACQSAHRRNSKVDNETRICKSCGKPYSVNKYSKAQTCSRSCGMQMRWKNKKG